MVTLTRKERILAEKKERIKKRRIKLVYATLAATITSSTIFYFSSKDVKAFSETYIVQEGDSLYRISKNNGISLQELKSINKLTSDKIYIGQTLELPVNLHTPGDSLQAAAVYTVVPGDTLWGVANRFGISVEDLKTQNNLTKDMVLINQKLIIMDNINYKKVKVVGAVDTFTVEFVANKQAFTLKVPYGTASTYQKLAGKEVIISYKNGALIQVQS
ncbi:LysM peptidoglycan-binding domain-containing protein [Bacillus sp. Bva_UNVM-123]|uniref:LysM peptidoglycan-binding domain-containing protein n=1 Tax=Bacillus sp. Bva_UNVM-123 TaxID=2829798 RepID=UPI00391F735D